MIDTNKPIIIIGAGVIGLSTALQLKQKGYKKVMIIAKYVPGDMCIEYTSPYAGNVHTIKVSRLEYKVTSTRCSLEDYGSQQQHIVAK